jgi:hypothetical protein
VDFANPIQSKKPPVTRYTQLFHHFAVNNFAFPGLLSAGILYPIW